MPACAGSGVIYPRTPASGLANASAAFLLGGASDLALGLVPWNTCISSPLRVGGTSSVLCSGSDAESGSSEPGGVRLPTGLRSELLPSPESSLIGGGRSSWTRRAPAITPDEYGESMDESAVSPIRGLRPPALEEEEAGAGFKPFRFCRSDLSNRFVSVCCTAQPDTPKRSRPVRRCKSTIVSAAVELRVGPAPAAPPVYEPSPLPLPPPSMTLAGPVRLADKDCRSSSIPTPTTLRDAEPAPRASISISTRLPPGLPAAPPAPVAACLA